MTKFHRLSQISSKHGNFFFFHIDLQAFKILLNVRSISIQAHYIYEVWKNEKLCTASLWKIRRKLSHSFPVHATSSLKVIKTQRGSHSLFHLYINGSYRDEESPVATTQPNSINVFTQFNSPSASSFIDCRYSKIHENIFLFFALQNYFLLVKLTIFGLNFFLRRAIVKFIKLYDKVAPLFDTLSKHHQLAINYKTTS